jgi:hypothetical protein
MLNPENLLKYPFRLNFKTDFRQSFHLGFDDPLLPLAYDYAIR